MEPLKAETYPLWGNHVVSTGSTILHVFHRMLNDTDITRLPVLTWEWNSSTNFRMKTIQWNNMTHSVMAVYYASGLAGIAVKYETDSFYDHDPRKAHPAKVVKVFCISSLFLSETLRTEWLAEGKPLEFRVKTWMDAREEKEIEQRVFQRTVFVGPTIDLPLWKRRIYFSGDDLKWALLKLSSVEDFRLLPELEWEWKSYIGKSMVQPASLKHPFMSLKIRNSVVAIAVHYSTHEYFDTDPKLKCRADVLKVYLLENAIAETESSEYDKNLYRIFKIQSYLLSHEAWFIKKSTKNPYFATL